MKSDLIVPGKIYRVVSLSKRDSFFNSSYKVIGVTVKANVRNSHNWPNEKWATIVGAVVNGNAYVGYGETISIFEGILHEV